MLPDLLGFTLGGYAMLLAFGSERFLMVLSAAKNGDVSSFMKVNAAFVHFIVVQAVGVIYALICSAWSVKAGVFSFVGFVIFVYSLFSALAAAFAVLRLAKWYDKFLRDKWLREKKEQTEKSEQDGLESLDP